MPMNDPLDNIMSTLRHKGGIDPNTAAHRKASLQQQRAQVGPVPGVSPQRGMQQRPGAGQQPSREMGQEGAVQVDERDYTPLIVDQMNETIISLKVQIHREQNPEMRRKLEKQAQNLREQIRSLGGDPIRADESVEDGLKKLKGYGYVGWDSLEHLLNPDAGLAGLQKNVLAPSGKISPLQPPPIQTATVDERYPHFAQPTTTKQATASTGGAGATGVTMPTMPTMPKAPTPATAIPDYYGSALGEQSRPFDELTSVLDQIGQDKAVEGAPALQVNAEYINNLIQQMGLEPRSSEEIEEHAKAIVERQTWERSQVIQRELERFDREFPDEYARAEKQISDYAKNLSAEKQEEFTARGMFYSSVMAGSLTQIDDKSMELIGEIARDAANYVAELRSDLRDISEWGILEQEVVRRELESIDRQERQQLFNVHLEVAMRADQYALDTWYKEQTLGLQERQQILQEFQLKISEMERMGMHLAVGQMSDHPVVQTAMRGMGITPQQFAAMPMEQRSNLVQSIAHYEQVEQQMRMNEVQMQAILADIAIRQQQLALQRAQLAESRRQFDTQMKDIEGLQFGPRHQEAFDLGMGYVNVGSYADAHRQIRVLQELGRPDLASELQTSVDRKKKKEEEDRLAGLKREAPTFNLDTWLQRDRFLGL